MTDQTTFIVGETCTIEEEEEEEEGKNHRRYESPSECLLHRAAFENDIDALESLLRQYTPSEKEEELCALDPKGNTPLHCAVINASYQAISVLLAAGASPDALNDAKWTPLDDAIALKDIKSTKLLLTAHRLEVKKERKAMKARLQPRLQEMQDFRMQLRWELGSPLFGIILRRYAPDDTYTIYKKGLKLRVDGSLRGIEHHGHSIFPKWKRGPFSLLVDASTTPVSAVVLDRTDNTYVDLYAERKAAVKDLDQDVQDLIDAGAGRVRLKSSEMDFSPVVGWFGGPTTATIDGYKTEVFEATGRLIAVVIKKNPWKLNTTGMENNGMKPTYDDYIIRQAPPEDEKEEVPWDPVAGPPPSIAETFEMEMDIGPSEEAKAELRAAKIRQQHVEAREVNGKCWMAEDYPMTLAQLLPVLEAMGGANKHLGAVAGFIGQYKDHSMFPLKIRVPLMWTVYLMMRFRHFTTLREHERDPAFYAIPPGFKMVSLMDSSDETFYEASETLNEH